MQLHSDNYYSRLISTNKTTNHFKLQNQRPYIITTVAKKLDANIHYFDVDTYNNNCANSCNNRSTNCCDSSNLQESSKIYQGGVNMEEEEEEEVCSMCGDVGIAELLFRCAKCSHRPQHIYCGRSYPNLCGEASICNWCLHEEDSTVTSSAMKATNETNVRRKLASDASGKVTDPIKELINYPAAHINEEYPDEVMVKKGHGKAFEYLLLIAAQSLPQVISEANGEIKQANHTATMIDITNPKMGSSDNKANCDLDSGRKVGSSDNQAKISNSERLRMVLDRKQDMELHSAVNMELEDVGVYGGNIRKRQRCSKGINAPLKCRKKGLQLSPAKPNYRRYKLLADVVC